MTIFIMNTRKGKRKALVTYSIIYFYFKHLDKHLNVLKKKSLDQLSKDDLDNRLLTISLFMKYSISIKLIKYLF